MLERHVPLAYDPVVDSEALLLSAMMWSQDLNALHRITDFLTPEDFYRTQYGAVYAALSRLIGEGHPHDPASVRVELRSRGDEAGLPLSTVNDLISMLATLGASDLVVVSYAAQVASESYRRQFTRMVGELKTAAERAPEDQLFKIMVEHGKRQRRAWQRYTDFARPAVLPG